MKDNKKKEELRRSLEAFGDFGIFVIDENNSVIAGNQRLAIIKEMDPETEITCKRLIGYTDAEKKAINIKDNTHAGEWDLDLLADWTADITLDLGLELDGEPLDEKQIDKVKEMELINHEKYDYVVIVCRNEIDYNDLTNRLGLSGIKVKMDDRLKKRLKARACWYDPKYFKEAQY